MSSFIKLVETFSREPFGLVRLTTDDGQVGYGQMAPYNVDVAALIVHGQLSGHVLGADPEDVEGIVTRCLHAEQKFLGSHLSRALAGIDTALWDLRGRAADLPVCALVGGAPRAVEAYGSDMSRLATPPEQLRRFADLRDRDGYRTFKVKVGTKRGLRGADADEWPGRTVAMVQELRRGLGPDVQLFVDANGSYTPAGASEAGRALRDAGVGLFEEPCPHWELGWNAEVASAMEMPVALGEQEHGVAGHRRIVEALAADVVQPDVGYIGGFTAALEVTRLADRSGLRWAPHAANRSLISVFALHLQATAAVDAVPLEFNIEPLDPQDQLFRPVLEVTDGRMQVPSGPGWGVEIDDGWLARATRRTSIMDDAGANASRRRSASASQRLRRLRAPARWLGRRVPLTAPDRPLTPDPPLAPKP